jgi:hypothetical protein
VQSEPNKRFSWGSCVCTAEEIRDFVPYLATSLGGRAGSTKIMIAEESSRSDYWTSATLSNPAASRRSESWRHTATRAEFGRSAQGRGWIQLRVVGPQCDYFCRHCDSDSVTRAKKAAAERAKIA